MVNKREEEEKTETGRVSKEDKRNNLNNNQVVAKS